MIYDLKDNNLSITEVLDLLKDGDVVYLDDITYYEKITIWNKNITFIGKENTKISFDAYHDAIVPVSMGGDGTRKFGTTGSATFTVKPTGTGFTAKNIIFENYFKRNNTPNGQAVAFKSEASNVILQNCKFISEQDTLYMDFGKNNIISNSYIEGDVDFIFGSADCIFDNCTIVGKKVNQNVYFTAPDTYSSNLYGFIFNKCKFITEEGTTAYLGRAWFPGGATEPVYPRQSIIDCDFKGNIIMDLIQMHPTDPREYNLKIHSSRLNQEAIINSGDITEEAKLISKILI